MNNKLKFLIILILFLIGCSSNKETQSEKKIYIEAFKQMMVENEQTYNRLIQIYECSNKNEAYAAVMENILKVYISRKKVFENQNIEVGNRAEYEKVYNDLSNLGRECGIISEKVKIKNFSNLVLCVHISTVESKILNYLLAKMHCQNEM